MGGKCSEGGKGCLAMFKGRRGMGVKNHQNMVVKNLEFLMDNINKSNYNGKDVKTFSMLIALRGIFLEHS